MEIKNTECPVCGYDSTPTKEKVYTVRQDADEGLATAFSSRETKLWDAMDCPFCGCQIRLARRLRPYVEEQGECCCGERDA